MNNKTDSHTEGHDQAKQNGISSSHSLARDRNYGDEKIGRGRPKFRISYGRGKAQMPSGVPTIREEEEKSTMPQKYENAEEGQSQEVYDATEMKSNSAEVLRPNGLTVSNPSTPGVESMMSGVESITPGVGSTMSGVESITPGVGSTMSGVKTIPPGMGSTMSGVKTIPPGVDSTMSGVKTLIPGVGSTMSGVKTLIPGVGSTMYGVKTIPSGVGSTMSGVKTLIPGVGSTMYGVKTIPSGVGSTMSGVKTIITGVGSTMSGVETITPGVGAIIISRGRGRAERKSTDVAENGSAEETSVNSKLLRRPISLPPAKVKVFPTEKKKLLRRPNSLPPCNPSEKQFHCHGCNQNMKHVRPDMSCQFCESEFVEEVDVKRKETILQDDLKNEQKEPEEFRCHNCKEKFKAISCPKMECPFCKSDFLEILSDSSDIFQSDEEQPVTSKDKSPEPHKYFCYQCTLPISVKNLYVLQCPLCKSGAIEEGWTDAENQHNWSDKVTKGAQEQYSVVEGNDREGWTDWKDVQSDPTVSYKTIDKPIENKKVSFIDQQRILMEQYKVKDTTVLISDPSDKMNGFQNQAKKTPIIKREVEVKSKPRQFSKKQVKKVQPLYKDTIAEYKNESLFQNEDNQPTEVKDGKGSLPTKRQMKRARRKAQKKNENNVNKCMENGRENERNKCMGNGRENERKTAHKFTVESECINSPPTPDLKDINWEKELSIVEELLRKARACYAVENLVGAARQARLGLVYSPQHVELLLILANSLMMMGKLAESLGVSTKLLNIIPRSDLQARAEVLYLRGVVLNRLGQTDKAIEHFEILFREDSTYPGVRSKLEAFRRALDTKKQCGLLYTQAEVLVKGGDPETALLRLEQALSLPLKSRDTMAIILQLRSQLLDQVGRHSEAEAALADILNLEMNQDEWRLNEQVKGNVLAKIGENFAARGEWEEAMEYWEEAGRFLGGFQVLPLLTWAKNNLLENL